MVQDLENATAILKTRTQGFVKTIQEKVDFGLVSPLTTLNPLRILFTEYLATFRDALQSGITVKQRIAYILAPPGWSHDGSRKSSHDIKREAGLLGDETVTAAAE